MLLKVGQLAERTGVTVRTLHHYHHLGLLVPAARSAAGYRLYNDDNLARLYQIQLLKGLGLSLATISELMTEETPELRQSIAGQRQALHRQLEETRKLIGKLDRIDRQLQEGAPAGGADLLDLLALMRSYERHFSGTELAALPAYLRPLKTRDHWRNLASELQQLQRRQVAPTDGAAMSLARRWMASLERDAARHPVLFDKLIRSYGQEQILQRQLGISTDQQRYIAEAFAHSRLELYRPLLTSGEFRTLQRHYPQAMTRWPVLLAELAELQHSGAAAGDDAVQQIAGRWLALVNEYTGGDLELQRKVRDAQRKDPRLREGSLLTGEMLEYLEAAVSHYQAMRQKTEPGKAG